MVLCHKVHKHFTDVQDPLGGHINSSTVDVDHCLIKSIKKEVYFPEDFELGDTPVVPSSLIVYGFNRAEKCLRILARNLFM